MSESALRNGIRSSVRGMWSGVLSKADFASAMKSVISRQLQVAWAEGALECGIQADELSEDEVKARDAFISEQDGYVSDFDSAIREHDKISGGKLQPLFGRAEMWVNRYGDARNQAKVLACKDKKLVWVIGPTERHCRDCAKYDTRVYRGSTWGDIRPQHPSLACHGYRCKCRLDATDRRLTRGKPSRMTG